MASWALLTAPMPSAPADPCPDAEVVFARGTTEAPGVGPTGEAFVHSLRRDLGAKSVGVYPVDYPATTDFPTALDGVRDASTHVEAMAAKCPQTQMVLGGYSQGAAVIGFVTDSAVPDGAPSGVPNPMPPDVASHVAAVALFGKPSTQFMSMIQQPPVTVGPLYAPKTVDLCLDEDLICAGHGNLDVHTQYAEEGLVDQAAVFVANHVVADSAAQTAARSCRNATTTRARRKPPAPAAQPPAPAAPPTTALPPQRHPLPPQRRNHLRPPRHHRSLLLEHRNHQVCSDRRRRGSGR